MSDADSDENVFNILTKPLTDECTLHIWNIIHSYPAGLELRMEQFFEIEAQRKNSSTDHVSTHAFRGRS